MSPSNMISAEADVQKKEVRVQLQRRFVKFSLRPAGDEQHHTECSDENLVSVAARGPLSGIPRHPCAWMYVARSAKDASAERGELT